MHALSTPAVVRYDIDADDQVVDVNDWWCDFARENQGEALLPPTILGRSLWSFISDTTIRELYRQMLRTVREKSRHLSFPLRCDSSTERRLLLLTISPLQAARVSFTSRLVWSDARPRNPLFDPCAPRTEGFLVMCSWCTQVSIGGGEWLDADQAICRLELFYRPRLPQISHSICPRCFERVAAELE